MTADIPLTPAQRDDLRVIAAMMIPASADYDVPGADDPSIQADIAATLGRDAGLLREALNELRRRAGQPLTALEPARREEVALELRAQGGVAVATLIRVVRSLGLEPRPPYPKGHVLEEGDWSLLDPVRARPPMWRRV